jgi:hypothetical protein
MITIRQYEDTLLKADVPYKHAFKQPIDVNRTKSIFPHEYSIRHLQNNQFESFMKEPTDPNQQTDTGLVNKVYA